MANYRDSDSYPDYSGSASSVRQWPERDKDEGQDQGTDDLDWGHDKPKDGPVMRLRYEFVLLVESLNLDFDHKYNLMKSIDDIIERHDLGDK